MGEMEEKTREGRSNRMTKDVVVFFQDVLGKNNFLVQFEDGQKRDISASLLPSVCSKEEVGQEVDDTISDLPKIGHGEL